MGNFVQMRKDPERRRITFETMAKFEEKGRVVKVDPNEHANMPPDRPKWTIPIHVTDKPGKPGQVRICHDCKASVRGTSLNDCLLEGPQLACDIRGVLMRFRDGGPVAVGADIKDYYHEIYITEEDAGIFRYYWFKDEKMIIPFHIFFFFNYIHPNKYENGGTLSRYNIP